MNTQNRRSILKVLTALPLMAFLEPLSKAVPLGDTNSDPRQMGQLNVIFHGLFVHMYDPADADVITAYAPKVNDHVYWAGNWQQEDENALDKIVSCELKGRFIGKGLPPSLREIRYPVIKCKNPIDKSKAACNIRLPLPNKIVALRRIHRRITPLLKGEYAPVMLMQLPLAYAFVYKYDAAIDRPVLENTNWKAPRRAGPVNLHVRAESPVEGGTGDGFGTIRDFLGYQEDDLSLNYDYASCVVGPDLIPKVHGLRAEEEYFLPELFPNKPKPNQHPGFPQTCKEVHLHPANCSGILGILGT
jgi:hypothetical protein